MKAIAAQTRELESNGVEAQRVPPTRLAAWLDNLERVPEGHATIFYVFLAIALWVLIGLIGLSIWAYLR